jgi:hypothetical protein
MLRTVGGILLGCFMLLAPGLILTLLISPKRGSLDFWKRAGMSLGLGVLTVVFIGVILALPQFRMLRLAPFTGAVLSSCVVFGIFAYLRGGFEIPFHYLKAVYKSIGRLKPAPQVPPSPVETPAPTQGEKEPQPEGQLPPESSPPSQEGQVGEKNEAPQA